MSEDTDTLKASKKVVIIDDSQVWLNLVSIWVKKYNEKVELLTYLDPEDYLKQIDELNGSVDCVIIDYYLNGTIAPIVIEKIREKNKKVLIVAISGKFKDDKQKLNTKEMKTAIQAGANRASVKDFHSLDVILTSHFAVRDAGLVKH